ncbi:WD40-repeat-containing domain protein [Polychytrium aggregatum]|uniref:WD40-repeat-containing domain protein n=1 Tax=Polychytrium aggregatum TaxID=110093 RepID=UPI0022FF3647|nr:WD40-repeat-containing domain protein [Polychytrium aggregatum]KAI9199672.1 WD40-repeat-containing domain protein [Polychytrium aggregatum]
MTIVARQISNRPLYALDAHPASGTIVVGGADHSLRTLDMHTLELRHELYSKKFGHREWVTTCCFLGDGQIVSGGMDSVVCLWSAQGTRTSRSAKSIVPCEHLVDHQGSISKVLALQDGRSFASASYDSSVKIWGVSRASSAPTLLATLITPSSSATPAASSMSSASAATTLQTSPVGSRMPSRPKLTPVLGLALAPQADRLLAGNGDGVVTVWDLTSMQAVARIAAHRGAVRDLVALGDGNVIVTGGNLDGCVRMFDLRIPPDKGRGVHKAVDVHGKGGGIVGLAASETAIFTAGGGDGSVSILDRSLTTIAAARPFDRQSASPARCPPSPDQIVYALKATPTGGAVASAGGGSVALVSPDGSSTLLPRHESIRNAIRDFWIGSDRLVGCGDDGTVVAVGIRAWSQPGTTP